MDKEKKREYNRQHYQSNKTAHILKNRRNKLIKKAFLWQYLRSHPCVDCGESDPLVLDFDHEDPTTKIASVAEMARNGWSLQRIKHEIDKCVARCANCHRRRTAKQMGWHKNLKLIAESSNGRTLDSESNHLGSNPSSAA